MKTQPGTLWRISVATTATVEEAVIEWLSLAFGQPPSSYTNAETGQTTVSVYLQKKPDWSAARQRELADALRRMGRTGLALGPRRISLTRVRPQDWAKSWQHHFKPLVVGAALLLKPSWSRCRPQRGQAVVILDPGLSFGTGHHPTTSFCLRQLVARRRPGEAQSCLDVGTGSGILAITAAKLGYQPVDALDFDPESIRVARANARRNGVSGRIRFRQQDLTKLPRRRSRKYSLICANLLAHLLSAERHRLLARLRADGVLVAAGILKSEFAQVQRAFERAGLRLVASRAQKEWRSGAFAWRWAMRPVGAVRTARGIF